jgi:hypothetical protein
VLKLLAIVLVLAVYVVMDVLNAVRLWIAVRPIRRIRAWRNRRKMRSWVQEHGGPPDEIDESFFSDDAQEGDMDTLKGALKSKLVWLGVAQALYGLFELWTNGALTAESAGPILAGVLTVVLRAVTDKPLSAK